MMESMNEIEGQHDMHDLWHDLCCCFMLCDVHDSCFVLQVYWGWDGMSAQRQRRGRGEVRSEEGLEAAED